MPSKIPRVPQQRPNSLSLTPFTNLQGTIHKKTINTKTKKKKNRKKRYEVAYLVAKRMHEIILQLRTNVVGKLATAITKENSIWMRKRIQKKKHNRIGEFEIDSIGLPRVDSEGCRQWSSENSNELVPLLRVDYPLLFVVEIESGVLGGERSPRRIVFCGRRIRIRFRTLPHVLSALAEMLSLSAGPASSPTTPHGCRLRLLLLRRAVTPFSF